MRECVFRLVGEYPFWVIYRNANIPGPIVRSPHLLTKRSEPMIENSLTISDRLGTAGSRWKYMTET
jgi:hypothetical protein